MKKGKPSILPYLPLNEHVNGSAESIPNFNREFYNNEVDMKLFYDKLYKYIDDGVKATYEAHVNFKEIQSMFKGKYANNFDLIQQGKKFMFYDKKRGLCVALNKRVVKMWYREYLK